MSLPLIVTVLVTVTVVLLAIVGTLIDKHAGGDDNAHISGGSR